MRKILLAILVFITLISLSACGERPDPERILSDIVSSCRAEGIIYSPTRAEGGDGYIDVELFSRIYITSGRMPESFAVFLNSHADYGAECGIFLASDVAEMQRICEMCTERLRLIDRGDRGLLLVCGDLVLYSTMSDTERVRELFLSAAR